MRNVWQHKTEERILQQLCSGGSQNRLQRWLGIALKKLWNLIAYAPYLMIIVSDSVHSRNFQSYSASPTPPTILNGASTMTNDSVFHQVPLDTSDQHICSPADPGFFWRGVLLRAPSQVALPENRAQYKEFIIPLCGLYLVNAADTVRYPGPLVLVVTDSESGQVYKGAIIKEDPHPTIPQPRSSPPSLTSKQAFGSYFNVNVAAYVKLSLQPARYRVKVEYAGHQSNEVNIEIVR